MDRLGISIEALRLLNPALITVSMPGFPSEDLVFPGAKAFEGNIAAATGQYTDIHVIRNILGLDPVYTGLPIASVYAAVHAATACVLALGRRQMGHRPSHIEVPLSSAVFSAMSSIHLKVEKQPDRYSTPRLPGLLKKIGLPALRTLAKAGKRTQARLLNIARKSYPALMTSYECRDGELLYLFAIDNAKITRAALFTLGLLEEILADGLSFKDPFYSGDCRDNLSESGNLSRAWQTKLKQAIARRLKTRDAADWEEVLVAAGVPCAVLRTTQSWMNVPALREAGLVVSVNDPLQGDMLQPGVQTWISDVPDELPQLGSSKPEGAYDWDIRLEAQNKEDQPAVDRPSDETPDNWLEGLTVIDMCSMVAGPVAGRTMAEYGARVIKIESPSPSHGPRMTCWYGMDGNQGKESIAIDLKTPDGQVIMHRLLRKANILITNQLPAAMGGMGLSEEDVKAVNDELIYCKIGAFNGPLGGPWTQRHGYDPVLQAASGIMTRFGDPGQPELHAIASCIDALTGYSAAFGVSLALYRQNREKKYSIVSTSLAAAATLVQLPYAYTSKAKNSVAAGGQQAVGEHPLYRLYQTKDGWLFLAVPVENKAKLTRILQIDSEGEADLASILQAKLRGLGLREAIGLFEAHELLATPVISVGGLQRLIPKGRHAEVMHLLCRKHEELGTITSAPAQQMSAGGGLKQLPIAEKPGSSSERILTELGFDPNALMSSGVVAKEVSHAYLPS